MTITSATLTRSAGVAAGAAGGHASGEIGLLGPAPLAERSMPTCTTGNGHDD